MAIHNGLHSTRVRKSIGLLTYAAWRGIPTVRSKATEVRNPRTTAQIIQRARMRALAKVGSSAKPAADRGFQAQAIGKSPYNVFCSENMAAVTGNANDTAVIDFTALKFSKGSLGAAGSPQLGPEAGGMVPVDFDATDLAGGGGNDQGVVVVANETAGLIINIEDDFARSAATKDINVSAAASGDQLHFYLFFRNPLTGEASATSSLGSAVKA